LETLTEAILRRAEEKGSLAAREIRQELVRVGAKEDQFKEVIDKAGERLELRQGRYYYLPMTSPRRKEQELQQQEVLSAIQNLVLQYRRKAGALPLDRRESGRVELFQPISLLINSKETHRVLIRDISVTGVRLLGCWDLLGQKVQFSLAHPDGSRVEFVVRIVWTCQVGDNLFENGGTFVQVLHDANS
jgi:hypothetical protein